MFCLAAATSHQADYQTANLTLTVFVRGSQSYYLLVDP